jgi:hypothetical protein
MLREDYGQLQYDTNDTKSGVLEHLFYIHISLYSSYYHKKHSTAYYSTMYLFSDSCYATTGTHSKVTNENCGQVLNGFAHEHLK